MGVGFGAAAPGKFRDYAVDLRAKWKPVIEADRAGTLDVRSLSDQEQAMWQKGYIPLTVAQLSAIVDWPPVEPADLRCPTLWVVGSANENAMPNVDEYQERLKGTNVALLVLPGLTHAEELTRIDDVLPPMLEFTPS
jgi:pimeloyl-ACP methyl ester carboxylesterase